MNQNQPSPAARNPILLHCIITIYLLMFVLALGTSCYLLEKVVRLKPVVLIDLLKYTLLCAIFLVLLVNGLKALTLKSTHLLSFENSVKNFKWLFIIMLIIALAAKHGLFSENKAGPANIKPQLIEISYLHIMLLAAAAIYCTWSHDLLTKSNFLAAEIKKRPSPEEDGL